MGTLGKYPFRCRVCKDRFYKSIPQEPGEHPADAPVDSDDSKAD
jgi:hypothetical protein